MSAESRVFTVRVDRVESSAYSTSVTCNGSTYYLPRGPTEEAFLACWARGQRGNYTIAVENWTRVVRIDPVAESTP